MGILWHGDAPVINCFIVGGTDFSDLFRKIIIRYKHMLSFNPITINNYASLLNCTPVGRASDFRMTPDLKLFQLVGTGAFSSVAWPIGIQLVILFCFRFSVVLSDFPVFSSCQATQWICRVLVFESSWYFS